MFGSRRPAGDGPPSPFMEDALAFMNGLYGTAVRLTRDGDAARDLVQDTYLKAIRGQERFQPGTNLKAWLYTILHNTWRNRRRDAGRARVVFDSDAVDTASEAGRPGVVTARACGKRSSSGARPKKWSHARG